jgi:hypothetical protein
MASKSVKLGFSHLPPFKPLGAMMPFAGPAVLKVSSFSLSGTACLTYRIVKNEDPDAEPVRPIFQVQTICRCKKGR